MNESYERALNQVSLLRKALNSQKTSHQNTLQQLQTTYQIINDTKQMLKQEQQKNKALAKQIRQKNSKIDQISREYEQHIVNIKELIERKDLQIQKYTQVKITDYDMIRFRVINQVEAQHSEEIQLFKRQIQKQEFLYNQSMFEIKVLRDKNSQLSKEIQRLNQSCRNNEQQMMAQHTAQISKAYAQLQRERMARKQIEKKMEREKQKYQEAIKKYHQELQTLQTQLMNRPVSKQNSQKNSNLNPNSSSLIHLKQSEFAVDNEKLKRQLKSKSEELEQLQRKHKSDIRDLNRKIDEAQKQFNEANFQIKQLQKELNESKLSFNQEQLIKCKKQFEKKERSLKERYEHDLETKQRQIKRLNKQIEKIRFQGNNPSESKQFKATHDKQQLHRLQREKEQLQAQLKRTQQELSQVAARNKDQELPNRQTRAVSVQNVREKLDAANAQIVTLLRDKIALTQKIARLSQEGR